MAAATAVYSRLVAGAMQEQVVLWQWAALVSIHAPLLNRLLRARNRSLARLAALLPLLLQLHRLQPPPRQLRLHRCWEQESGMTLI
jgi:hypothetical protein